MSKTYRGVDKKKKPQYRGKRDKRKELLDAFEKEEQFFTDVPEESEDRRADNLSHVPRISSTTLGAPGDIHPEDSRDLLEHRDDDGTDPGIGYIPS